MFVLAQFYSELQGLNRCLETKVSTDHLAPTIVCHACHFGIQIAHTDYGKGLSAAWPKIPEHCLTHGDIDKAIVMMTSGDLGFLRNQIIFLIIILH